MLHWNDEVYVYMRQLVFGHLTRVQSPWLKCRPFPCRLTCLCCSFAVWLVIKLLEGLQWKEEGCGCLNNSSIYSPVPTQRLSLAVSHELAALWSSQVSQDGSWCLTKCRLGLVVQSPACCALTRYRNELHLGGGEAFTGTSESLNITTKPITLLRHWMWCISFLFIFSSTEGGPLLGWEGNKFTQWV